MKRESAIFLSITAISLTLFLPQRVQALSTTSSPATQSAEKTAGQAGQGEAMHMVPAEATLVRSIDARKAKPGQQFKATLSEKVQLKNGPELPRGTELIGTVANDDMHASGNSRLALRFTQADLKDGKVVPIKATIVSVYSADSQEGEDQNFWTPKVLQIDQEEAMSGVDLHSKIADRNSGVFVTTKKDDVKLPEGYGIALAIAPREGGRTGSNNSNGGA